MELSTKLEVLAEFLSCANVTFWHFDKEMSLLSTNTESDNLFQALFAISDNKQTLHQYSLENQMPGFCSDAAALLWLVCPRHVNGVLADVYVIGPVFGSETSEQSLIQSLQALNIPPEWSYRTGTLLRMVPVVPHTMLIQYGLMLHLCLTGDKLEPTDFRVISPGHPAPHHPTAKKQVHFRSGTYALEEQIFRAVEEGNINHTYPAEIYSRETGSLASRNPLRHAKNELVVCLTLITRAAIRGGLSEDTAYALSDWYIQMGEASENVAEVYQYTREAFQDFTRRVHKCKQNQGRSKEILECTGYLELHLDRQVTLDELARALGYNKNYLSTKFRREVGMPASEYILRRKIEQACLWLLHTDKPVQAISDELGFNSPSYFSAQFRKITGQTPTDYRNRTT